MSEKRYTGKYNREILHISYSNICSRTAKLRLHLTVKSILQINYTERHRFGNKSKRKLVLIRCLVVPPEILYLNQNIATTDDEKYIS